jgi:glycolate oxidase iron-sulfur subunit
MGISIPEVETATAFFADLLKKGAQGNKEARKTVTFHDPCRLARDLAETERRGKSLPRSFEYFRDLLKQEQHRCCGGEVMNAHSPEIAKLIAENRLNDAKRTGGEIMVTACPACADVSVRSAANLCAICFRCSETCGA